MKTWSVATNEYFQTTSYIIREGPWHIFLLGYLSGYACHLIGYIPIINWWVPKLDWSLYGLWHIYVCSPIDGFCCDRITEYHEEVEYAVAYDRHEVVREALERWEKMEEEMCEDLDSGVWEQEDFDRAEEQERYWKDLFENE